MSKDQEGTGGRASDEKIPDDVELTDVLIEGQIVTIPVDTRHEPPTPSKN